MKGLSVVVGVVLVGVFVGVFMTPGCFVLEPLMQDERPFMASTDLQKLNDTQTPSDVDVHVGPLGFMAVITPSNTWKTTDDLKKLQELTLQNRDWLLKLFRTYGGIVFRGFKIDSVYKFDDLLPSLEPGITAELYLGTSPRNRLHDTKFVSTASEFPQHRVIPEHLEMSFKPNPPKLIFFYADTPNTPPGGQTPVSDFRKVWADLPKDTQNRFKNDGMKYIRCYYTKNRFNIDPLRTKTWQDMFDTEDKKVAEERAIAGGFTFHWEEDDICLSNIAESPTRIHDVTGDEYWGNHLHVLHGSTFSVTIGWAAQLQKSWTTLLQYHAYNIFFFFRNIFGCGYGHHVVNKRGGELNYGDVLAVRKAIAKNSWIYSHQKNDVVWLDNQRIAHGRQPWYGGPRKIYVAWVSEN